MQHCADASTPSLSQDPGLSWKRSLAFAFIGALLTWLALFVARSDTTPLAGVDAYYHLRCASYLSDQGLTETTLPWTRLSLFATHWADKEFLFHVALIPFASPDDLMQGGKLALTTINALQVGILLAIGLRWFGLAGLLLPLLVLGSSLHLWYRLHLLRPPSLSLVILLLAAYQIQAQRYKTLAILSAAYALTYIAWHALLILCIGTYLIHRLAKRPSSFRLVCYPAIGLAAGLALHPAFPHNLQVWWLNNVDFYRYRGELNLGIEIEALTPPEWLLANSAGLLLLALALCLYRPSLRRVFKDSRLITLGSFCGAFCILYACAARFAEYAIPFACLFAFAACQQVPTPRPSPRIREWRTRCMLVVIPLAFVLQATLYSQLAGERTGAGYFDSPEAALGFQQALPDGALVAANWDDAAVFMAAAPQARYLNALDPVFMRAVDATLPATCQRLFHGHDPSPADTVQTTLRSTFVAARSDFRRLKKQLLDDPAFEIRYDGKSHYLFELKPSSAAPSK